MSGLARKKVFNKILQNLGLAETTTRVYAELLKLGKATARQLAENLSLPRPSVYDHLKILIKSGLAVEFEENNKKIFRADDPKQILALAQSKIEELKISEKEIRELLPKISEQKEAAEPRIKFYPGADGFRRVLNDILWHENIEVLAMWPFREMTEVVGDEYLKLWTKRRVSHGIKIRSIWPHEKFVRHSVSNIPLEETRIAPKGMEWAMGSLIYADKVSFISSRAESFGFIVTSTDFAELERAKLEAIWKTCRPVGKVTKPH